MPRVFLSYSRHSEDIAKTLARDVEALGHEVWFDQELSGGQTWWDQILAKVRDFDVFILVVDPQSLESTACKREYGYAADLGKPILPVLVSSDVSTNLLPPALSQIQFVDYVAHDRDAAFRLARAFTTLPPLAPLPDPLPPEPEAPVSYLGNLTERVESTSTLNYQEQSALLVDLKGSLREPETAGDARTLLERFRKRRDLLAFIAQEIDELLATAGQASPKDAATAGAKASQDSGSPPRRRAEDRIEQFEPAKVHSAFVNFKSPKTPGTALGGNTGLVVDAATIVFAVGLSGLLLPELISQQVYLPLPIEDDCDTRARDSAREVLTILLPTVALVSLLALYLSSPRTDRLEFDQIWRVFCLGPVLLFSRRRWLTAAIYSAMLAGVIVAVPYYAGDFVWLETPVSNNCDDRAQWLVIRGVLLMFAPLMHLAASIISRAAVASPKQG